RLDLGLGLGDGLGLALGRRLRLGLGLGDGLGCKLLVALERRRFGRTLREDLLGEVERRRALHGLGIVRALGDAAALDALEREREAAPLGVDLDDLRLDEVALRNDLARVLDVVLRQLGD